MPCALVTQAVGDALKARILLGTLLVGSMSWADVVPRSAPVVAWEFWTNSNDECGVKCDNQKAFMQALAPEVSPLLQARVMTFTPHYITLQCGPYADQAYCQKQCINNGRYCQQDPDGDLEVCCARMRLRAMLAAPRACSPLLRAPRRAATAAATSCWRTCARCACSRRSTRAARRGCGGGTPPRMHRHADAHTQLTLSPPAAAAT